MNSMNSHNCLVSMLVNLAFKTNYLLNMGSHPVNLLTCILSFQLNAYLHVTTLLYSTTLVCHFRVNYYHMTILLFYHTMLHVANFPLNLPTTLMHWAIPGKTSKQTLLKKRHHQLRTVMSRKHLRRFTWNRVQDTPTGIRKNI